MITMVIRSLDDRNYCARSALTRQGLWWKLYGCSWHHFTASQYVLKCVLLTLPSTPNLKRRLTDPRFGVKGSGQLWKDPFDRPPMVPISSPLTQMVYLSPFLNYLASSKHISVPLTRLTISYHPTLLLRRTEKFYCDCIRNFIDLKAAISR